MLVQQFRVNGILFRSTAALMTCGLIIGGRFLQQFEHDSLASFVSENRDWKSYPCFQVWHTTKLLGQPLCNRVEEKQDFRKNVELAALQLYMALDNFLANSPALADLFMTAVEYPFKTRIKCS
uniref:Uncharacterized protein n=1 Tax=Romanomermis culicivorax TaxID=13658 RepID=A0A915JP12_ROMCU